MYSLSGRPDDAARVFAMAQDLPTPPSPMQAAVGHLAIGDVEESLRLLREAANTRLPTSGSTLTIMIKRNMFADPVLERPEFVAVRSRLGFN